MPPPTDAEHFALGDVVLQHGATLRDATLAYQTYGELNPDKSNAILYPTWFSGWHTDNQGPIGPGRARPPAVWCDIVPNMLGNGRAPSPSTTPPPYDRARFPHVTFHDQVECQYRLVTEHFGIETLPLVTGWSMGAGQTYQWAVSHPEMVQRAAPFCGSSVTADHNKVFLYSLGEALRAAIGFDGGFYDPARAPVGGLRAFARIYAGWGFSQAFYWQQEWRKLGFSSLEDFLIGFWEGFWLDGRDPNNLLAMLWTWEHGDVGQTPGFDGDTVAALSSIRCPLLAMPAEKDLYFPPEDEQWATQHIPGGEVRVIPGVWGHFAGGGQNPDDTAFIDQGLRDLLARPV